MTYFMINIALFPILCDTLDLKVFRKIYARLRLVAKDDLLVYHHNLQLVFHRVYFDIGTEQLNCGYLFITIVTNKFWLTVQNNARFQT